MWKAFTIELVDPQSFFVLIYTVLTFLVHLSLHVGCFLAILKMTNNKTLGTKMAPIWLFGNFFFNFYSFWMTNELLEKASKGALNYFKQTLKHKLFTIFSLFGQFLDSKWKFFFTMSDPVLGSVGSFLLPVRAFPHNRLH